MPPNPTPPVIFYASIPGNPPPGARPRARIMPRYKWPEMVARARQAKSVRGMMKLFVPQVYHPSDGAMRKWMELAERILAIERTKLCGKSPIVPKGQPLAIDILCVFELAKSHHRKTRTIPRAWSVANAGPNRGDWDNLGKPICDAASGVLWHDDSQIVSANLEKVVGAQGEEPRMEVIVRPMEQLRAPDTTLFEMLRDGLMERPSTMLSLMHDKETNGRAIECPPTESEILPY